MMICLWMNLAYSGTVQTRPYGVSIKRRGLILVSETFAKDSTVVKTMCPPYLSALNSAFPFYYQYNWELFLLCFDLFFFWVGDFDNLLSFLLLDYLIIFLRLDNTCIYLWDNVIPVSSASPKRG